MMARDDLVWWLSVWEVASNVIAMLDDDRNGGREWWLRKWLCIVTAMMPREANCHHDHDATVNDDCEGLLTVNNDWIWVHFNDDYDCDGWVVVGEVRSWRMWKMTCLAGALCMCMIIVNDNLWLRSANGACEWWLWRIRIIHCCDDYAWRQWMMLGGGEWGQWVIYCEWFMISGKCYDIWWCGLWWLWMVEKARQRGYHGNGAVKWLRQMVQD
jgi:hypothetical protein